MLYLFYGSVLLPVSYASVCMHQRHTVVGLCICVYPYMYVCNLDFSKVAKNQVLAKAVQAQHDNISNLIVLDFS